MSPVVLPIDSPMPDWPRIESRPYRRVSDLTMLAAIERAARHSAHPDKPRISRLLGFDFSGAVSRSMEKQLQRMRAAGLAKSEKSYRHRQEDWFLTDDGRRHLEERRDEVGPLPESPEHRRWRSSRALAAAQLDEVVGSVLEAITGAEAAVRDRAASDLAAADLSL